MGYLADSVGSAEQVRWSAQRVAGKRAEQDWQRKRARLRIGGSGNPESWIMSKDLTETIKGQAVQ